MSKKSENLDVVILIVDHVLSPEAEPFFHILRIQDLR